MNSDKRPVIQDITDTARWVACFRARETQRPDPLFVDPYADRLAGERGYEIAARLGDANRHLWAWVTRTYLFDQFLLRGIAEGADLVLNLAAGLDARPYRLPLPAKVRWVEVDLPRILSYKSEILRQETPHCQLERIALDLSDRQQRRDLFHRLDGEANRVLIMAEGLLLYFTRDEVGSLSTDLSHGQHFRNWIIDLTSAGQLLLMQRSYGKDLGASGAAFQFAPAEGPDFFVPLGWGVREARGILKVAAEFGRAPKELLALLPEPKRPFGAYPWTGVCLLQREPQST
jgi:methyltransferase (TIGR00027 family)